MNKVVVHEPMDRATLLQLVRAAASPAAHIMDKPRCLWAIAAVVLPPPRQFTANRAGRATKKAPDHPLAAATIMLGEYHATFLAAEVLALSVHRNILCPVGVRCCTCNLSLSCSSDLTLNQMKEALGGLCEIAEATRSLFHFRIPVQKHRFLLKEFRDASRCSVNGWPTALHQNAGLKSNGCCCHAGEPSEGH